MNLAFKLAQMDPSIPKLPGSLHVNRRLGQWLKFHADGRVSVYSGKVEIGQGIVTALAQIAAEELDLTLARVRMVPACTATSPDEQVTSGSMSVQESGTALRHACAEARAIYLEAAATRLEVPLADLEVEDGVIRVRGTDKQTSYWDLADDDLLDREATGLVAPKIAGAHHIVGSAVQRFDIPDKVTGKPRFVHDMVLPGMLYGRVARPPSPDAELIDVDLAAVNALPGVVATVRDGRFLGVIAEREELVVKALKKLIAAARWRETASLPDMHDLPAFLKSQPVQTTLVAEKKSETPPPPAAKTFAAAYARPFLAHASIGPSCAIAKWNVETVEVWTHSQGIYNLRTDLAMALSRPAESIVVQHVEGSGCYGHNPADDVAYDAVLLARAVPGKPVQMQWTREDELGWAPFGAAMAVELKAEIAADGRVSNWHHEIWSNGHGTRPGRAKTPAMLAASHLEKPFERLIAVNAALAAGGGSERNSVPLYNFDNWEAVNHRLLTMPIRTSALRSLGGHCNVFAIESFLDEIALELGVDPLEYRLRHLEDPRGRAVLEAAAKMSGWARRNEGKKTEGRGMGIAFAKYKNSSAYCAVVAQIDAGREVRVEKLWIAVDVGLVINPDGVRNQIEGGAIQTVSWTLKEAVRFDRTRVESNTWETYPILKFSEVPKVEVELINRTEEKCVGAGEATHGPVAAAIGNAVFDALGVRVRSMPLTAEAITKAALAD
ncbi:MAG: molybdopterin-dependent oxidoreductase [Proteobacteria bacterium]|nr:molybdopterin-dependent oxidoreductase [Pseudomonadota bacterium]